MRSLAVICALLSSAALADDANVARLHEAILDAPTEWCAADAGVPVILTIDGPALFVGVPLEDQPTEVLVRRGGGAVQRIEVGRKDPTELITRYGTEGVHSSTSTTSISIEPDEATPVGRLMAEISVCQSLWGRDRDRMAWRIVGADGVIAAEGVETVRADRFGVFDTFRPYPQALKLGDETFVLMVQPEIERTTEAFVAESVR